MDQESAALNIPKPGYRLLKKVYRSFQRIGFIIQTRERSATSLMDKIKAF
jgi:hypothetical protein